MVPVRDLDLILSIQFKSYGTEQVDQKVAGDLTGGEGEGGAASGG